MRATARIFCGPPPRERAGRAACRSNVHAVLVRKRLRHVGAVRGEPNPRVLRIERRVLPADEASLNELEPAVRTALVHDHVRDHRDARAVAEIAETDARLATIDDVLRPHRRAQNGGHEVRRSEPGPLPSAAVVERVCRFDQRSVVSGLLRRRVARRGERRRRGAASRAGGGRRARTRLATRSAAKETAAGERARESFTGGGRDGERRR